MILINCGMNTKQSSEINTACICEQKSATCGDNNKQNASFYWVVKWTMKADDAELM